jgi:hypothetical protein
MIRSDLGRISLSGETGPPLFVKTPAEYGSVSSYAPLPAKVVKTGTLKFASCLHHGLRVARPPAMTTGRMALSIRLATAGDINDLQV